MTAAEGPITKAAFDELFQRHAAELRVHFYRMLGSLDEAEDLVQETFLRAWRSRENFGADGRFEFRAWLYRIATNACVDVIRRRPRRVTPPEIAGPSDPEPMPAPPVDLPWLQPYPDRRCRRRKRSRPRASSPARRSNLPSSPRSSTCPRASAEP